MQWRVEKRLLLGKFPARTVNSRLLHSRNEIYLLVNISSQIRIANRLIRSRMNFERVLSLRLTFFLYLGKCSNVAEDEISMTDRGTERKLWFDSVPYTQRIYDMYIVMTRYLNILIYIGTKSKNSVCKKSACSPGKVAKTDLARPPALVCQVKSVSQCGSVLMTWV